LVFAPSDLKDSCDTFALEFIEIQQQHVVIFGDDYFGPLTFRDADVRLQCERELKVALIGIQHGLLTSGDEPRRIEHLCHHFGEQVLRTLHGLLWLKGERQPRPAAEAVGEAEKIIARQLSGVRSALAHTARESWPQLCELHADVKALGAFVDAM
jgi:hypothetical protein